MRQSKVGSPAMDATRTYASPQSHIQLHASDPDTCVLVSGLFEYGD
jgi:hypothetical protein